MGIKRERVMLNVMINLDPVPGTMHTAESAQESIQAILLSSVGHYDPVVVIADPE
jgi:hypothetical protein